MLLFGGRSLQILDVLGDREEGDDYVRHCRQVLADGMQQSTDAADDRDRGGAAGSFWKIFAKFLPDVARYAADFVADNPRWCRGRRDDPATRGFEMTQTGASDIAEVEDVIGKLLRALRKVAACRYCSGGLVKGPSRRIGYAIQTSIAAPAFATGRAISSSRSSGNASVTASASISRDLGKVAARSRSVSARSNISLRASG